MVRRLWLFLCLGLLVSFLPFPVSAAGGGSGLTESEAMALAVASGKQVEVTSLASPTGRVVADPSSGGFVAEVTSRVSRVQSGGVWREASARLVERPDGSWGTEATPSQLSVGGAGGRLLEFREGASAVSLWWPGPLPTPVVSDSSAFYADVVPGVDLVVQAQIEGVGTYLVVRDAAAARNPALDRLRFGIRTEGVTTKVVGSKVALVDVRGAELFTMAAPFMWDSTGKAGAPVGGLLSPGRAARLRPMGLAVRDGVVELTPDLALLRGADTTFPVVIDPYVHDDPTYVVRVSEPFTNHNRWDVDGKVGYQIWDPTYGPYRDPGTSGKYQAVVTARVPRSALSGSDFSRSIDPWHFKSGVVTVPESGLPALNGAIEGGIRIAYR